MLTLLEADRPSLKALADRFGLPAKFMASSVGQILDAVRISCAHSLRGLGVPLPDACRLADRIRQGLGAHDRGQRRALAVPAPRPEQGRRSGSRRSRPRGPRLTS